ATTGEHTYTYALSNDIKVGKDGKDGIDGKIGVNGKDGSSVVINGKDGSIGLNGKDGKDGLTIRGEKGKDGVDGKNGTNGITRIVYEDHNHDKHEVATLDDGMKYAGDDAQGTDKSKVIVKKLNETMDIVGGADKSKLTDNNIGVNNVDGKLKVQLSKEVNLTPSGSLTIGDTVVNNNGLTISGGPSIIKTGINAGNLNITNVKAGVNDTDAVNVKQLKDARTVVTSNDNSVTVNKTENGNQVTYDLHVAPGAAQSVWNVKSTGNTTADSEATAKTISDGKTVEMAAGKNLTVKQTSNNDGAKVEFDLANDIKIGKDGRDGVDGKIGVNGKDGSSVVINGKDGSIGLNGKDGKDGLTMKGEKGADGVTRIVYEDHDNNKHEVATLDDGLRFDANSGGEKKNKLGSKVTVKGTGAKADSEYDSSNIKTSITQGADGNSEINIGLAKDLNNINTIKNGGPATFTIGGNEFKFDGGNVNMGGNNITNLKSGIVNNNSTDDTNGANIGDVKTISKANDLHIAPTTSNRTGETTTSYAYDTASKSVTLKYNDGNGANQAGTIAKIDLSGLADQIKDGYSFSTDAKGNVVGNHAVTAVGNGKTISYAAGDNLTIAQHIDNATGEQTYTYALSNDIKIGKDGKDGVDGKIGVNGKDGSSVVINGKDGSIGLNGKDGKDGLTIRGEKGQDGVDGKNGTNGITRIVYEDHNNDKHEVATLDDGMKYAGDDAQGTDKSKVIAKKLNETMDVVGGADKSKLTDNNIGVNNVDGKLKVQLSKEVNLTPSGSLTIGDTVVNNSGLTISGGPSIIKTGINAGNLNITNVKAGVNDTDAVNVKQLKDARTVVTSNDNSVTVNKTENGNQVTYDLHVAPGAAQSVWNVKSTGNTTADSETAPKTISDGKTVEMAAGKNLTVKQTSNNDGAKVEFDLANDIKIGKDGKDGVDGKIGVNGKDGSSVVINGKDGSIGLNGKDGKDGLTMKGEKGADGVTRIVYEDHDNNKHEVATLDDGLRFDANSGGEKKNKLGSKVTVKGTGAKADSEYDSSNIKTSITQGADGNSEINIGLAKDLNNINTIKNGGPATFTIGGNEFKFDGGNVNMGGNNITNLKSGIVNNNSTDDTNGANIGDVKNISKANDLHIAPTTSNRTGETTTSYAYDTASKSVTLKYNDGNGANQAGTIAKIDLSGLADQIKDGYSFSTDAKGNVVGNHAVTAVGNGKTVSYAAGDNLTIAQNIDNATGEQTYTYALSNDIKIGKDGKDGIDGKIGVNGKDGSSVVINGKDGSIGLKGKDGKDGLTMKGEKGADGVTRIVYEDHDNNKHEVATLDDGLRFDANSGGEKNNKLGSKVTVKGTGAKADSEYDSSNIKTSITQGADGNSEINIGLAKDLNNINTIKNGGPATFTIGGNEFKFDGGNVNMGGNNITNLKSGIVNNNSTDDTNGANIGDVKTISKANDIHVKDTRYTVNADKTVTLEYVDGNDKKINKTAVIDLSNLPTGGNAITYKANNQNAQTVSLDKGLNFMDGNYTKASVDADGIVKYDVTIGKVKDGVDGKPGVDGNDGIATVKTVVDTINNSGWKGDVTGNTVGNHTATIVKPGTTVNFGAGKNVTVEQIVNAVTGDHTYNYALSDDIKLGKDGKDGVDGRIGVNGKDGSSVVINGKDGSIGLNGKDGKDGLTMKAENGQPGLNGKDGITRIVYEDKNNNKHEVATLDDGLRFTGNNEVENKQKLGSLVKIKGEGVSKDEEATFESAKGNIAVTADGTDTLTVRLNKNIKGIDSIQTKEIHLGTPDNYTTIKKDGDRIKYGDKTIANTDELWTIQANGIDVPANGGKVNVKGVDGITVSRTANGEMTISGSGLGTMNSFNVKSTGNTADGSETAAKKIIDGKTVEFSGGNNVTVKQTSSDDGAKVEFALKNNIDLTQDGSVKIGDTKITNGGLVINNGPSITKDGINAGNKQITNVEDGVNDTDAVNVRQLKDAKTKLVDGQNTTVTGDGSKNNPYKVNVEGDLKKITSITNNDGDGKLEFKGDQVVNVAGDNTIKLDGKTGDITGLTNKTLDSADFATKGRAATEEQLKLVQQEAAKKSTEKVQAKADANNIAKVAPKAGDTFGAAGATYEVSVDKNDVKDVAREAVTVSGDKKAITVDVQPNATNHTTNYQVNFNGKEAAKQIPLTYKENGSNARTVMLSDGLDFTNGVNTTAHTAANGKVSFDVKGDLTNITSISNNSNGPKMSFGGDSINITGGSLNMGDNYIHNVKAGEKNTDAVNVSQLKAAKTEVEAGRNVTVEHRLGENGQDIYKVNAEAGVDPRVDKLGEEIGHVGAQSAALSALKPIQYDPMEPTQIMAGYGNYRGNSALALGVAHYKNESTMFHAGVSWAGGNGHMMANAGVTWKVGNRDSEAAVADRYRKGPISSTYAMQTEVASMKAQNAGLKGEVSDLKAENEQIKAQNAGLQSEVDQLKAQMAAMMAKLGM
ncbi:hemagglutinin, partial [Veillonella atypica ACS-134-V-Col7a]